MRLPQASDPAFFDQTFRPDHAAWRAGIVEVCAAHRLKCDIVSPFADGSNLVAAVNDRWVVKIFPTFHHHQWESERRVLAHLRGETLPLKVPTLIAEGTRDDGWLYVVMEKLPGLALATCWDEIGTHDRVSVMEQIGSTMAAVHRLPLGELASLPPEWGAFLRNQKVNCRKRHTSLGVPQWFEQGLDDLVGEWAPENEVEDRVLLTGEYTPFNVLVQRDATGWQLTGMIDFGDAMVGPRDYDFLGPSMFSCAGEPLLVTALLRGYFGKVHPMNRQTRMRLMALAALHRYANFNVQLCIPTWRERAASFEALAELVWPSVDEPR
jgi:hygromycin-B 7''-O-kinase